MRRYADLRDAKDRIVTGDGSGHGEKKPDHDPNGRHGNGEDCKLTGENDGDPISLLPACVDDYVGPNALVRVVDSFVDSLDLAELGFSRVVAAATGRPGYQPGDMLRIRGNLTVLETPAATNVGL